MGYVTGYLIETSIYFGTIASTDLIIEGKGKILDSFAKLALGVTDRILICRFKHFIIQIIISIKLLTV